ncbi:hypothetical protein U1Q18_040311 [Sarracenia purpurea var. burkii]
MAIWESSPKATSDEEIGESGTDIETDSEGNEAKIKIEAEANLSILGDLPNQLGRAPAGGIFQQMAHCGSLSDPWFYEGSCLILLWIIWNWRAHVHYIVSKAWWFTRGGPKIWF